MRKSLALVLLLVPVLGINAYGELGVAQVERTNAPAFVGFVPDEVVVQFKTDFANFTTSVERSGVVKVGEATLDAIGEKYLVTGIRKQFADSKPELIKGQPFDLSRYHVVHFSNGATPAEVLEAYKNNPLVESVEPIGIHAVFATPNDGLYPNQWHLNRSNDKDIDAPEAWDVWTGSGNIIVADMDTGIRYYHKDLGGSAASSTNPTAADGNMWVNLAEKNGTAGVDDDGNGYVDDWIGWDFVTGVSGCWSGEDCSAADNDPRDFNGHGTHTAGLVAAINNNGYAGSTAGGGWGNGTNQPTANGVKVMGLRIGYSGTYLGMEVGYVNMSFAAQAFNYARIKGAKIATCSWGSSNSGGLGAAIDAFVAAGGLIFKAAGNSGNQTADYMCGRTDVISVAATDSNDCKADFSTYGTWVDISSPGTGILSTYHVHADAANDYVATLDGTSMATPLAAGVAAMIWSRNPNWTAAQVRDTLYATCDAIDDLSCNTSNAGKLGRGRVNAYRAVTAGGTPCAITANFTGTPTSGCSPLNVNFTDASTGSPTTWSWTFGDGGTSTVQNPSHQYASAGTYTVALTVGNGTCNNTMTRTGYITVGSAPTAAFTGTPTSGDVPLTVAFTDQSTGVATAWSWTFGDGGTSTVQNPVYTYTTTGTYSVSLTASNACGSNLYTRSNYITVTTPPTQQCDDFADGSITNWLNKTGTWTATGGYMRGNSNTNDAKITSPFGSFTSVTIGCDVRMNSGRNSRMARVIFGYVNANNYRFVEADDVNNRWRIYSRVNGTNTVVASWNQTIITATWYHVEVQVASDGTVTLIAGSTTLGSYRFPEAQAGLVGCGFSRTNSDFDNFCVSSVSLLFVNGETEVLTKSAPVPAQFQLNQNHPNPFNPSTVITYSLMTSADVELVVINVLGQQIRTLVNQYQSAGDHSAFWDGKDQSGNQVASGIYFYRMMSSGIVDTKKMLLMK